MKVQAKLLPPRNGHIEVPVTSKRDALAGLSLYTASRGRALAAQRTAWWLVRLFGPAVLPGRRRELALPFNDAVSKELRADWEAVTGPFDSYAAHLRRPMARSGIALLLLRDGSAVGFVKLRSENPDPLFTEQAALASLAGRNDLPFVVPEPLRLGATDGWHYLVMSALPAGIHRPPEFVPLGAISSGLAMALRDHLPRPAPCPDHWEPMHGDLTLWNLRSVNLERPVLLDWEDATWGPPHADALWFEATRKIAGLDIEVAGATYDEEVRTFWTDRLTRIVSPGETSLQASTLAMLRSGEV